MRKVNSWNAGNGITVTQVLAGRSNAFLVSNGVCSILVDSGPGPELRNLERNLGALAVSKLDFLVLTHSHYDHAENARSVRERFGAKIVIHRSESSYLESGIAEADDVRPVGTNPFARFFTERFAKAIAQRLRYIPCSPDILVDDEYDFSPMGINARIVHTPGHTVGSISVVAGDSVVLAGDAMFGVFPRLIFPPFATDIPALVQSWGKLLSTQCSVFLPSHGTANDRALVEREYARRRVLCIIATNACTGGES